MKDITEKDEKYLTKLIIKGLWKITRFSIFQYKSDHNFG